MKAIRKISSLPPKRSGVEVFERQRHVLRTLAYEARDRSKVHRDFRVGVSALVRIGESFGVLSGANRKLMRGFCPFRRCGEMEILDKALLNSQADEIVGFYIAAPPQPDDMSGEDKGVLIPCVYCRNRFRSFLALGSVPMEPKQLITWNTRFVCENIETGIPVPLAMDELMEIGRADKPSMIYIS